MERDYLRERTRHGTSDFPVAMYRMKFDQQYDLLAPLHYHKEFELVMVTEGMVTVQIEKDPYTFHRGEGAFVNSGQLHVIRAADGGRHGFIAVVFDPALLCEKPDRIFAEYIRPMLDHSLFVPAVLPDSLCGRIEEICAAYEEKAFGYELYIKSVLYEIFFRMMKNSKKTDRSAPQVRSGLIKAVTDYIRDNYFRPISLQNLADQANISKEYLCRIFNEMTGVSPIYYLNWYRIRQSTDLLLESSRSISDIAFSCGFNNSSYYSKLFLRYMGCTPMEYRKKSISF